ncbi:hypothetical protein [Aquimarina sp. I32.4]|uniref:hypothetical protein n=1 Tax=Aquimarina sp. I32.4 TaxID=2053903 RepID=UPI0011AF1D2C|nr:hypothetical protein [Aquimarina sp. I32.4]
MAQSTLETEGKIKNKILPFIKGGLAFLLVTLSLFHVFFDNKSDKVPLNNKKYDEAIANRDNTRVKYLEDLKNRRTSIDEYYTLAKKLNKKSKKEINEINAELGQINKEYSFRGRSSFHFWIFVFGLVTALFFFSCKSLHDDFSRGSTYKFHFVSFTGILVSMFWFIHLVFLTQKDFAQNKYIIVLLACAILCSAFTYFLVKYYTYKDDIIYKQLSFLERLRVIHYPRVVLKAKYAEKVGLIAKDDLDEDIDNFQEDLKDVIKGV